ncbi:MurR/RpiR family transcriptional regulator [Nesterenkonia flava]|uniref:MurR/RpiR family transcriptional regulator n=1 Tax=Nesterenkonia flava TaxID=469799 RepID=A0ABU1FTL7_9MICC|nr:MurR/RpiR family transcriptional regulator [Nesterenkonia flava]MDR5711577.1 MurR/RpiR family transcriptional regulator [Nesterenkonia flava]
MTVPEITRGSGGVLDAIRSALPSLIPSERRVAERIVGEPEEVLDMSAAEMASSTQTSAATVSRACQNLGFKGFQHLRMLLAREVGARRREEPTAEPGVRGYLGAIFRGAADAMGTAADTVDDESFIAAAEALRQARRVLVVSSGGSAAIAQSFAFRMTTSARSCEAPADSVSQLLAATGLTSEDVCVVVSESGSNTVTLNAADAAKSAGATLIGVTAYSRTRLTDLADHCLIAGAGYHAWREERIGGNIVLMILLGALHSAVVHPSALGDGADDSEHNAVSEFTLERVAGLIDE